MTVNLTDPIFSDEAKARAYFEAIRWPNGPVCCHCGNVDSSRIYPITANVERGVREGLYECQDCHGQFTVRTRSVMESSHLPLTKWALAYRLMASAKKGISAHQMHRTLGVTYKTAWFLCHRIREAMRGTTATPMGGEGKTVEIDETYVGGKPRHREFGTGKRGRGTDKVPVVALVERDGGVKAKKIQPLKASEIKELARQHVDPATRIMTDEWRAYGGLAKDFAGGHETVKHSIHEYARGDAHINTAESFFALLKRGVYGSFHHISAEHLDRYCDEFSFRWSRRKITDAERAEAAIKGAEGKRLTYRNPSAAAAPKA